MKNKAIIFLKKEYALIAVSVVFLYFAITFISGAFNFYKVKMADRVTIVVIKEPDQDRELNRLKKFYDVVTNEGELERVEVTLDLTQRFQSKSVGSSGRKKLECWQCSKMIPIEKTVCPYCGAIQKHTDNDKDGMPDYWEIRYQFDPEDETDAAEDPDGDKYVNLEEYRSGSDPLNPQSTPITNKFHFTVTKIFRKPVELLFRGYIEINHEYTLEINWEGKKKRTFFSKVGDILHGYEIQEFKKIIVEKHLPERGVIIDIDKSFVLLKRKNIQPLKLTKNKVFIERELYASLINKKTKDKIDVHVGSEFETKIDGRNHRFTVTDITIDQVFYKDDK